MLRFECDYAEGAHPQILESLMQTNNVQTPGYGEDDYCDTARKIICLACGREDMDVHFLVGGTQANATVIKSILRPHQAVICAETGHIATHESGAIEATGHKVITIPSDDGKISAEQVWGILNAHYSDVTREHCPQPGMVYISQPTETGLIYSKSELLALRRVCDARQIPLYADGARLGYALAAEENDVFMAELAELCDVFYIGGTKCGAMFGEAVCITNDGLKKDFRYLIKQQGGMLAKGRFLGLQFETLFKDGLYIQICQGAVRQAGRIKDAFRSIGCDFLYNSPTNQIFPVVSNVILEELSKKYTYTSWREMSATHTAVRFVTSWATDGTSVNALVADIKYFGRQHGEKTPSWSVELPE